MPVSPHKAIGSAACAFAIVCTLVLVQQFNSETWLQNPPEARLRVLSTRLIRYDDIPEERNEAQTPPNRFSVAALPASSLNRDPMVQPAGYQAAVGRYPLLEERAPRQAVRPHSVATNPQTGSPSFTAQLAAEDQATLKSLPPACTTDIETLIGKSQRQWPTAQLIPATGTRDGQDCHMGVVPGVDAGYSLGPAAEVGGKVVNAERKHSNHTFYGPGYSIAHPGIFPQNTDGDKWRFNQWLEFDWRSDWGKEKFEDDLADGLIQAWFPPAWQDADARVEAREVVEDNLKKLNYKKDLRRQLLENGSKLDGPFFADPPVAGRRLNFRYCLTNTNPGHNMPSGSLGAQPQLWMNVVLIGPARNRLWETGHVDSNGDLADNHSLDVLSRVMPFDDQLFNLQTKFLTQNVKGTDREMYLPINFDVDQLPFIRPAQQPVTVLNHPPGIRMEGHSLPALASRNAKFSIPARLVTQPGTYRLSVRMRSRADRFTLCVSVMRPQKWNA